ncbi:hypothetical protein ACWJJH_14700 [Endozoicomonadaceae bacterium StTr2]
MKTYLLHLCSRVFRPIIYTRAFFATFLSLLFFPLTTSHIQAAVTEQDVTSWTEPSGPQANLQPKGSPATSSGLVIQQFDFTEDMSPLAEAGYSVGDCSLESFTHSLKFIKPENWDGQTLIVLINASDGVPEHLQPDDLQQRLTDLPLAHDTLKGRFAILEYRQPLPAVVKYTLPEAGEIEVKKPLGMMQCSWLTYKSKRDEKLIAELQVIKSIRRLIPLLKEHGVDFKELWISGYQTWARCALLARAIPEVTHVEAIAYERTALTSGLQPLIGPENESTRGYSASLIDSFSKGQLFSAATVVSVVSIASDRANDIKEGIQSLLLYSPAEVLKELNPLLADKDLAHRVLEITQPVHWSSPDTTETVLLCTGSLSAKNLKSINEADAKTKYRLLASGKNDDLTCDDVLELIRSDMLLHIAELAPSFQLVAWHGLRNTSLKLKHTMHVASLHFTNFWVGAPGAEARGLAELTFNGSEWRNESFRNQSMLYVNAHFTFKGLSGRLSTTPAIAINTGTWGSEPDFPQ